MDDRQLDYTQFLADLQKNFEQVMNNNQVLFHTTTQDLFNVYLQSLPEEFQQHYNCSACKHFVTRFGDLAVIDENGALKSALWGETSKFFTNTTSVLKHAVENSQIKNVFLSSKAILGIPVTGEWHHMSIQLPESMVTSNRLKTSSQLMAEKHEEYIMLSRALADFSEDTIAQTLNLVMSDTLYRGDICKAITQWFSDLHHRVKQCSPSNNIIWNAVATAPTGFCHIKSSMIGTLLSDIAQGLDIVIVQQNFEEKMKPSNYQRSQSLPTMNAVQEAEKLVAQLGIADSLHRKYAQMEEIPTEEFIWLPKTVGKETTGGVFANVLSKIIPISTLPSTIMTWDKFTKTVLPTAQEIEVKVDSNRFMALVTKEVADSENLLIWNNPFTWYYHGGIDGEIKKRVEAAGGRYENNEIRCSLIWEGGTDLDIHCITPTNEHIWYNSKRGQCSGWLDIDANGGHITSYTPVENMRWAKNAPRGHYRFYVHNYEQRDKNWNMFKVELDINGEIYTYSGSADSSQYEQTIFEFDYVPGHKPMVKTATDSPMQWNIDINQFAPVTGIIKSPNLWGDNNIERAGNHTFFLIKNCKDVCEGYGRGFFVEMLKPELKEIRKTLESFLANTPILNKDGGNACGVGYTKDHNWNLTMRVKSNGASRIIQIDRFD